MKRIKKLICLFAALCLLLCLPAALGETRQAVIALEGMEETFEDIGGILHRSLEAITYDSITIVK